MYTIKPAKIERKRGIGLMILDLGSSSGPGRCLRLHLRLGYVGLESRTPVRGECGGQGRGRDDSAAEVRSFEC